MNDLSLNLEKQSAQRILVLTGGGDAPGMNAVLRAFVKAALNLGLEVWGSEDAFEGLIDEPTRVVRLKLADIIGILPRGGSILGCSNRSNPFEYIVDGLDGAPYQKDCSQRVLDKLDELCIDILVLIGGDGTQNIGMRLTKMGVPVIGIPKTIDNDLAATDQTFGLDSAVGTATWAIDTLHCTAEAHDRVMILEVMGRDSGWIAMQAGLAGGADIILIPEIPYDIERIAKKIQERSKARHRFSMIVVGEGAKPIEATISKTTEHHKAIAPKTLGAGEQLHALLQGKIDHEIRVTVLGHLQRGVSPSAFDRLLGTRFGTYAAHLCSQGTTGVMVALRGQDIVSVPLEVATANLKRIPQDSQLIKAARALGVEIGQD